MKPIVLASGSAARVAMLRAAGVPFEAVPADVDEEAVRAELGRSRHKILPEGVAMALAEAKAMEVARRRPEAIVIGSDQVLALDDEIFAKPAGVEGARAQLRALRGRSHVLHSAVVIVDGGRPVWADVGEARLAMRDFSEAFLDDYLARAGVGVLACVGCYQVEGLGVTLFSAIAGDHFTILGMPLVPLLGRLRDMEAIPA